MVIQIERMSARAIVRSTYRCAVPTCTATATWSLVDRGVPEAIDANVSERACCIEHIVAAYLSLRGAHLVARGPAVVRASNVRPSAERRRQRKRRSIAIIAARELTREAG